MPHSLLPAGTVLLMAVVSATAFLATSLNSTDPDVASILCPKQMTPQLSHLFLKLNSLLKPLLKIPLWLMKACSSFSSTL
ncbi:hypothetical protein GWK47_021373 [Chionoecetes opilio]|uniref:Secreted protein n=1 Tax=Chionoecetes opilio TaxID=41210 RepID=A0A8J4XNV5_CHIOP|nr:hypothetical protein GWK47_021373 [Chionoecetes opilio]